MLQPDLHGTASFKSVRPKRRHTWGAMKWPFSRNDKCAVAVSFVYIWSNAFKRV